MENWTTPQRAVLKWKEPLPRCWGASFQGGGGVGPVSECALTGHDEREGYTGLTGTLTVGVGHGDWINTTT